MSSSFAPQRFTHLENRQTTEADLLLPLQVQSISCGRQSVSSGSQTRSTLCPSPFSLSTEHRGQQTSTPPSLPADRGQHSSSQHLASHHNQSHFLLNLLGARTPGCLPWGLSQLSSSLLSWQLFWLSHTKLLSMQRPFLQWNRAVEHSKGFAAARREEVRGSFQQRFSDPGREQPLGSQRQVTAQQLLSSRVYLATTPALSL